MKLRNTRKTQKTADPDSDTDPDADDEPRKRTFGFRYQAEDFNVAMRLLPLDDDERCQGCKYLETNRYREFIDYFCLRFRHPVGRRFYEMEKDIHHGWGTEPIEDNCWEEP